MYSRQAEVKIRQIQLPPKKISPTGDYAQFPIPLVQVQAHLYFPSGCEPQGTSFSVFCVPTPSFGRGLQLFIFLGCKPLHKHVKVL